MLGICIAKTVKKNEIAGLDQTLVKKCLCLDFLIFEDYEDVCAALITRKATLKIVEKIVVGCIKELYSSELNMQKRGWPLMKLMYRI
jgi:hypothetical protein